MKRLIVLAILTGSFLAVSVSPAVAKSRTVTRAPISSTFCTYLGNMKICRTRGKKYDKVCTTTQLNNFEFTKCRRERHRRR